MAENPSPPATNALSRLVLCFDGTWNTPEDRTSVSHLYGAVADRESRCPHQLKFYDPGVGTEPFSRFRGGALGWGLDKNILDGYAWLINRFAGTGKRAEADGEVFDTGPDILVFGFSRGAYTARSLVGLINRCGLPRLEHFTSEVEHGGRAHPDAGLVQEAWKLYKREDVARSHPHCVAFRKRYSWDVKVKLIGVWDTVGALGVPMFSKSIFARMRYGFHDTALGRIVEHAYHAVAIDECREDYEVALWDRKYSDDQVVEQRWFPGAHANVGGGYENDRLPAPPLKWMAERAIACGLEFTDAFKLDLRRGATCSAALPEAMKLKGDEHLWPVRDSYAEFLYGAYRFLRRLAFKGRYFRPMLVSGVAETIDETARLKWAADPAYRPPNLAEALGTFPPASADSMAGA